MQRLRMILAAISVCVLASCGGADGGTQPGVPEEVLALLKTVPSDALALSLRNSSSEACALLDSSAVLHALDCGRLADSPAVISWSFDGELSPVLAIDAGRSQADRTAASELRSDADSLGLHSCLYAADSLVGRHAILVISPSDALLAAVDRHVKAGRSILDAEGFQAALASVGNSKDFTVMRNSGAQRLLPRGFLDGISTQSAAARFLRTVADWVAVHPEAGGYRIDAVRGDSPSYFTNILESLPYSDSRLGEILPADTEFALSLPVPEPEFREAYERFTDASVRSTEYLRRIEALEELSGKNPLDWEKENGICEVGLIVRDGARIAAVRPGHAPVDAAPSENPFRGFISALYGSAFSPDDDGSVASYAGWLLFGSPDELEGFIAAGLQPMESNWPVKGCHIVMYKSGMILCWNKKGINLWSSHQ